MQKPAKTHRHLRSIEFDLHSDLEKLKEALSDTTHDVKEKAGEILAHSYQGIRERSTDLQDNVTNYVAEKPFKSLGLALLSGVIIGFLIRK